MTTLFSSAEATAFANFLVFAGLFLAVLRIGRSWLGRFLAKFSVAVRKAQQKQLLADLKKIRSYRPNKFLAVKDVVYGLFDDIMTSMTMLSVALVGIFIAITVDANFDLAGRDAAIWEVIYGDHVYWITVFTVAFGGLALLTVGILWSSRFQLRYLKYASDPELSRLDLLNRYLKLRALR